jgi:hypothetical protein
MPIIAWNTQLLAAQHSVVAEHPDDHRVSKEETNCQKSSKVSNSTTVSK